LPSRRGRRRIRNSVPSDAITRWPGQRRNRVAIIRHADGPKSLRRPTRARCPRATSRHGNSQERCQQARWKSCRAGPRRKELARRPCEYSSKSLNTAHRHGRFFEAGACAASRKSAIEGASSAGPEAGCQLHATNPRSDAARKRPYDDINTVNKCSMTSIRSRPCLRPDWAYNITRGGTEWR